MSLLGASLLRPVIALNIWTFSMEAWMYATRIPGISKYCGEVTPYNAQQEMDKLPPQIKWKADNYNHLFEQPTQFYAIAITLALLGAGDDDLTTGLAWTYVGMRVAHSFVQSTTNTIMVRFGIFACSSFVLLGMTAKAATLAF
ncbi:hypothetical protein NA57DRAFT_79420 [Rhizodiscina lignyota]|uniref:MAPEG family protein n=1 Tax=Rhizodiscina lignyota TaxID=1504668 RepID=A0A9P4M7D4_9PEZI|nr:hypothetical protein NA57DRAFT_79420 [Rhizodiscina lignyota]